MEKKKSRKVSNKKEKTNPKWERIKEKIMGVIVLSFCFYFGAFTLLLVRKITYEFFSSATINIKIGFLGIPFAMSFLMFHVLEHVEKYSENLADSPLFLKSLYVISSFLLIMFLILCVFTFFDFIIYAIELEGFYKIMILIAKYLMMVLIPFVILTPSLKK